MTLDAVEETTHKTDAQGVFSLDVGSMWEGTGAGTHGSHVQTDKRSVFMQAAALSAERVPSRSRVWSRWDPLGKESLA